jgi:mediator of replication checkpoint protein 1
VEGKRRAKRRDRGIGLSDSESEDSESENRRRTYSKKRKIDNDTLDELGRSRALLFQMTERLRAAKNPETQPFHKEYMRAIALNEDEEFAYLSKENEEQQAEGDDESGDEEKEDEEEDASNNSDLDVPMRLQPTAQVSMSMVS